MNEPGALLVAADEATTASDLDPAIALAKAAGWKVELLHVVGFGVTEGIGREQELADRAHHLGELVTSIERADVSVEPHVIVGPTIEVILERAEEWEVDMIAVVGRRHHTTHRLLLGSTTSTLLKVAHRPVVVVPPAEVTAVSGDVGLRSSLELLIDLLDRDDTGHAAELRQAAAAQLGEVESTEKAPNVGQRLKETVERFETDHPALIRAINDVSYYLSGMGI